MIDELETVARHAFDYPDAPVLRRHGPLGCTDYRSFKPWLRDEFSFRCILCLDRERWHPNGQEEFSVDHVEPRSIAAGQVANYDNLLYIVAGRRWVRGRLKRPGIHTNTDALIGQRALVTQAITAHQPGQVRVHDEVWRARPTASEAGALGAGAEVIVEGVDGVTLLVRRS